MLKTKFKLHNIWLILLFTVLSLNITLAQSVNNEAEFLELYKNGTGNVDIELENDIVLNENLESPSGDSVTIYGNDRIIDGSGHSGIVLEKNQTLDLEKVQMQNFRSENGGGIYNNSSGKIKNFDGKFLNNFSKADGGVMFNSSEIDNISGEFKDNCADINGGVIYNNIGGEIKNISGRFENNHAEQSSGGAIFNVGVIDNIDADFENNYTTTDGGGALTNWGDIDSIKGNFKGNRANSSGGAIYNIRTIKNINANFFGNTSEDSIYGMGGGGAIYNNGTIEKLSGRFENNSSKTFGGAIHNIFGTINIVSDENETLFNQNTDSSGSNAIYNEGGVINFNAGDYDIIINDAISGSKLFGDSTININPENENFPNTGKIVITDNVSQNDVNMYNGTLKLDSVTKNDIEYYGNFDESVNFNYYGGTIDVQDGHTRNTNLGNLTLHSDLYLKIDGNCQNHNSDTITADSFTSNDYKIDITDINILEPATEKELEFCPVGGDCTESTKQSLLDSIEYKGEEIIETPIFKYETFYDADKGVIVLRRIADPEPTPGPSPEPEFDKYNPAIFTSAVASQLGGYLMQLNSYNQAFDNMDMYMIMPLAQRKTMQLQNKYAYSGANPTYQQLYSQYSNKSIWLRPYSIFENVPLKNGTKVSNVAYGTFLGGESELIKLKKGWDLIWGAYLGYNGSHQTYGRVGIYQNGATLGTVAGVYKGNFFSGLTVNAGANGCEANNMYGKENFGMFMTGIASKTAYNFEIGEGRFIIQPNYLMSYTFVNTFDYTNAAGVRIRTKPLNAIQISPGIKLIWNLNNGWQPYLGVNMIWNIIDKTEFKANDVSLPELSVKPFVAYGVGVRKIKDENFSAYAQAYVTNGGRNGVGLLFGCRWRL